MKTNSEVVLKILPNPANPKLNMKYVGAKEYATPKTGRDGKVITGFDENALSILNLPAKESEAKQKEVRLKREHLEKVLGVDLTPSSSFWSTFFIVLDDDNDRTFDANNAKDQLDMEFLVANKYVAPSREAIDDLDGEYANCVYYLFREKEELGKRAKKELEKDKAIAKIFRLKDENPNQLKAIAAYLFGLDPQEFDPEEAYMKLKDYINIADAGDQQANITKFNIVSSKSPEQLQIKTVLDKAVKKRLVTSRNEIYKRGDVVYGDGITEALQYLESPENSGELIDLMKAVGYKVKK